MSQIELSKTDGEYPDQVAPAVQGAIQLNYRKDGSSYVILVSVAPRQTMQDFFRDFQPVQTCVTIHGGTEQELLFRHLYTYPADEPRELAVLPVYSPEVGLYHEAYALRSPVSTLPTPENLATVGSTGAPSPTGAFMLRDWQGCSPEIRPTATDFLQAVQAYAHSYFDLGQHPRNPDGLLIVPHPSGSKSWILIRTEDLESMGVLEECINVLPATHALLQERGFGGEPRPQINYAPALGFYLSR